MKIFKSLPLAFAVLVGSSAAHAAYVDLTHLDSSTLNGVITTGPNLVTIHLPGTAGPGVPSAGNQSGYVESNTLSNVSSFEYNLQGDYYRALFQTDALGEVGLSSTGGTFSKYTFDTPISGYFNLSFIGTNGAIATLAVRNMIGDGPLAAVPAVPEPETYAMLLAGLGLMGAVARRRNKTPTPSPEVAA